MAHRTPAVHHDTLVSGAAGGDASAAVVVDTDAWFAWLETATTFSFVGADGHFTARKERPSHGRGGWYWRAYRRWQGRLLRAYLGQSQALTLELLRQTAAVLNHRRSKEARRPRNRDDRATAPARQLRLRLLGDFSLVCGDEVIEVSSARIQWLLAHLALRRESGQTRQQLAFLFWPDSSEAQARNNLRQLVHQLRRMWPAADRWLNVGVSRLAWRREVDLGLDVEAFDHSLARADEAERVGDAAAFRAALGQAVAQYRADLLPGCYEDWIAADRERLRLSFARALDRLIAFLEEQRDYSAAIAHAQGRLQHDPLDEESYRRLMRLHALNDDRVSALRVYHACVTMLDRELAVQPSPTTSQVYAGLLSVDARPTPPAAAVPTFLAAAPLVGRRLEWNQLQAVWREASGGAPHLVVVGGDAGIGKSRLAEELLTWASRQGVSTARTRAYAAEGRLAYAPVADWLRSDGLYAAVCRSDAASLGEVARLLPELLNERPDILPPQNPLTEQWQRQEFFAPSRAPS